MTFDLPAPASCPPTITVFGSCRVYNPCALLARQGHVRLAQANIFGFVHSPDEVLQQFRLITAEIPAPRRLRAFLNIPDRWQSPAPVTLAERFATTDLFVVEVSSVRNVRFKALLLQINRTREILAADPARLSAWWQPLVRDGVNNFALLDVEGMTAIEREIMPALGVEELDEARFARSVEAIAARLGRPVLFVPHFDTDMTGATIPQRSRIIAALRAARLPADAIICNPTPAILAAGVSAALADAAHYRPVFEPVVAALLHAAMPAPAAA